MKTENQDFVHSSIHKIKTGKVQNKNKTRLYASLTLKWNWKLEANAIKSYCSSEEEN